MSGLIVDAAKIDAVCGCVVKHSPKPHILHHHHILPESWNGLTDPGNMIYVCPNTHYNIHKLIDEYVRAQGKPVWAIRRKFPKFVRDLAQQAWDEHVGPTPFTL